MPAGGFGVKLQDGAGQKGVAAIRTVDYTSGVVRLLDQTLLPAREVYVECRDYRQVAEAIRSLKVRGAPAIGVAAAMGIALGVQAVAAKGFDAWFREMEAICALMAGTRPTAANLFWAIERMKGCALQNRGLAIDQLKRRLQEEARRIQVEDLANNRRLGEYGGELLRDGDRVLTHCNAGALATAGGYGTALGVIRAAHYEGKQIRVLVAETRPVLQGARLTAWELKREQIPFKLITDSMAGHLMQRGEIDRVVVGADRIAANGDTANKIGTYTLAVVARAHALPFYVAAPTSTIDLGMATGEAIPIEERSASEVTTLLGVRLAPEGVEVANPAFDVTPHPLISAIITERGIIEPPYLANMRKVLYRSS